MSESGKLALFIDGANLYSTARALGFDIDFKKLLAVFAERGRLLRAFYYTPMFEDQEGSSTRPLIDWLSYNGHDVRTRSVRDFADQNGRRKARSSLSIELAVNAFEIVPHVDEMVLFTGDGDFRPLVEAVPRHGIRVTIVSTIAVQPPLIGEDLRRQADAFIELADLRPKIARDERPRPRGVDA
jgi:uncharacterized LabA/DUF88 family protein